MQKKGGGISRWLKDLVSEPGHGRKIEFLGNISIFAGLSPAELSIVLQALSKRDYHKDETLCEAGAIGNFLFLIESGMVEVLQKDKSGRERRLTALGPGDFFGEMAVLSDFPRAAKVVALEPVKAYLLYKTEVEKLVSDEPAIGAKVCLRLARFLAARLETELGSKGAAA